MWKEPPPVGNNGERLHPGEDYNCRCWAEPASATAGGGVSGTVPQAVILQPASALPKPRPAYKVADEERLQAESDIVWALASDDEKMAIHKYTKGDYARINPFLLTGKANPNELPALKESIKT